MSASGTWFGKCQAGMALLLASGMALATPQIIVPAHPVGAQGRIAAPADGSSATPVRFNAEELFSLPAGSAVELTLPNGTHHRYVLELTQRHGYGTRSFIARHEDLGARYRAIVTNGPGGSFAVLATPRGQFRLIPGGANDWLVDASTLPREPDLGNDAVYPALARAERAKAPDLRRAETFGAMPGESALPQSNGTPTPQAVVDILFVVTNGLADNLGADLNTRMNFLVTRANTAFADSGIAITLRLARTFTVDYPDTNPGSDALYAITPWHSQFDDARLGAVEEQRAQAGADLVAFLRDGGDFGGGGIAWLLVGATPRASIMYSAITGCVRGCESVFIHEIGHNMGNHHDRRTVAWQDGGVPADSIEQGAFPYSYGYAFCKSGTLSCNPNLPPAEGGCAENSFPQCSPADGSNFRDIMAYGSEELLYKFSNPLVDCVSARGDGVPRACGVDEATTDSANAALSMNNMRMGISALFQPPVTAVAAVPDCADGPLPIVCALPDLNADALPDLAVVREAATRAEIRDGRDGTPIHTLAFLGDAFTPAAAAILPDTDGDGVLELAVLGVRESDRRMLAQIRNLDGSGAARQVWFASGHAPLALAVVADGADDVGTPELAVLSTRDADGRGAVEIRNASGAPNPRTVWAPAGFTPRDLEIVPDADDNGVPHVALLLTRNIDGRNLVQVRSADGSGTPYSTWFALGQTAIDLAVVPDKDADGRPEVAVLSSRNSDGRPLVELKNASGEPGHHSIWLPAGFTGVALEAVKPADGGSAPEIAVLSRRNVDGRILVSVRNAFGADTPRSVWYTAGYAPLGLTILRDVNGNGIAEAGVLMRRASDGRIVVQSRDTSGPAESRNVWFAP